MSARRMHTDEVMTDAAQVARLVAAQFPQWASLPVVPVASSGTDHAIYRLGAAFAVRLPRIERAVEQGERERRWLPWLAPQLTLEIPSPLARGAPAEGYPWPWSVYRWIAGEHPVGVAADGDTALVDDLAAFLAALHAVEASGGPPSPRGVPLPERDAPTRAAIAALGGAIDATAVAAAWERDRATPAWHGRPAWVHADLAPGNLLMRGGRLCAVIDFGLAGTGDPACDLIVAWNLLDAPSRARLHEVLDVDDATWARGRGWALSVALIQWPYYGETNPTLAASARRVVAEVLRDHREG